MRLAAFRFRLMGSLAGFLALLPGGCPVEIAAPSGEPLALAPGRYWITQHQGQLYYFDLPEQRGQPGRRLTLPAGAGLPPQAALPGADPAWFVGEGLYELRPDLTWTVIQAAASSDDAADADATEILTLDAILQLHDPPPPPP